MRDAKELADRYIAIWNEADATRRRAAVTQLWTEDAVHLFQPPQEVVETATALDATPIFQARGHGELEARVARAYEKFVAPGQFLFRSQGTAVRVADAVNFNWEMASTKGQVAGAGREFVVLAADGRIRLDYQFIAP
jgi:hypothetical protein